ncbi:TonB-dependent siderophore receptor [Pseudomonas aeruginosa]|uniref:TonB-dependent siderophore receptor n=1 Tax=Pseudomonas aeruginosa TaxID=287 RepID=UPI00275F5288|nr:TonB-dependent siderophore receptor [Pseudomonas aeruginosa]HEP9229767.1 TonB-dependent siderophore receptor [Pseudomonas aeruginosa]
MPSRFSPPRVPRRTTFALTLRAILLGSAAATSLPSFGVQAEQADLRRYDLPAGSLEDSLNGFAQVAGITLPFDPALTQGKQAPALQGEFGIQDGLDYLLGGSGLAAERNASGHWAIFSAPAAEGALEMGSVTISGKAPGSVTEGSGEYTTASSSSSTRLNLALRDTPQSITVMTDQRIKDQNLNDLTEVMEATTGISVSRVGVGAENDTYWSRGFQINNFEVDGVPSSSRLGNFSQSTAMYDRIEIVRGATGLISGLGTPSATINMIRKRPTAEAQTNLSAEAGSWDRYGLGMDVSGPLTETGNVRGRLVLDYKTQNSWVDRYKQDNQLVYAITEFDLDDATLLTAGFSVQKNQADSPLRTGLQTFYSNGQKTDFSRSASSSPDWSYFDVNKSNVFVSLEHQFDNGWSAKAELGHTEYEFDELINYMNGEIDQATGAGAYLYPNRWSGTPRENNLDAYLTGPFSLLGREHELIAGITLSRYRESTPDRGGWYGPWTGYDGSIGNIHQWSGAAPRPDTSPIGKNLIEENQYAAYATSRWNLRDDLKLLLGGRVTDWKRSSDNTPYEGTPTSNEENRHGVFLPYAGLVYDLNDTWSAYASYTKIFNPQAYGIKGLDGKPLDPQEGTGYEVGIKAAPLDGRLNASLALFRIEQDNLAVYAGQFDTYYPEKGTTTEGLELEMNGELADGWNASAGYAYSVSRDQDDERIVTNIPRHSLKTFTSYRLPGAWNRLTLGGGVNWQSKIGQDLHTFEQGSYALVNVMARFAVTNQLDVAVNVNNLFDRTYYSYADSWSVYGAPRNLMTTLNYHF